MRAAACDLKEAPGDTVTASGRPPPFVVLAPGAAHTQRRRWANGSAGRGRAWRRSQSECAGAGRGPPRSDCAAAGRVLARGRRASERKVPEPSKPSGQSRTRAPFLAWARWRRCRPGGEGLKRIPGPPPLPPRGASRRPGGAAVRTRGGMGCTRPARHEGGVKWGLLGA